jgi:hypothetical protein
VPAHRPVTTSVKRPVLTAMAEMYVGLNLTLMDLAREVAYRRKTPRICEHCTHAAFMHYHPDGLCMFVAEGSRVECECEGMFAYEKYWRVL